MRKLALVVLFSFVAFFSHSEFSYAADPAPKMSGIKIWQEREKSDGNKQLCGFFTGCAVAGQDVVVELSGISYSNGTIVPNGTYAVVGLMSDNVIKCPKLDTVVFVQNGKLGPITFFGDKIKTQCQYYLAVDIVGTTLEDGTVIEKHSYTGIVSPEVQAACGEDECDSDLGVLQSSLYELCSQIKKDTDQYDACMTCFTNNGVWTAVGCIPSQPESIIKTIITIGLAIGGGVVLVMIMVGSFMLSVSQGDPNKTKEAREIITSAIIGLLFVIFSVTILQFIGVSILHIPGFGE